MSSRLTLDGTAEPVSRDQILRRDRGQEEEKNPVLLAVHEQDWQLYPVDPYYYSLCYKAGMDVVHPSIHPPIIYTA